MVPTRDPAQRPFQEPFPAPGRLKKQTGVRARGRRLGARVQKWRTLGTGWPPTFGESIPIAAGWRLESAGCYEGVRGLAGERRPVSRRRLEGASEADPKGCDQQQTDVVSGRDPFREVSGSCHFLLLRRWQGNGRRGAGAGRGNGRPAACEPGGRGGGIGSGFRPRGDRDRESRSRSGG